MFDETKMAVTLVNFSLGSKSHTVKVRYPKSFHGSREF